MKLISKKATSAIVLLLFTAAVAAQTDDRLPLSNPTDSAVDVSAGMTLYAERQHQSFDNQSADIDTVALDPYLQFGNWTLSADIPWQQIDGDYFVNNNQPTVPNVCLQIAGLNAQQLTAFINRRPNGQALVDYCAAAVNTSDSSSQKVSGLSDITTYLGYGDLLDQQGLWYGMIVVGVKWDNADTDEGLGSGTQDLIIQGSANADNGVWIGTLVVGYNAIIGGELESAYDDYVYGSADIAARVGSVVKLGGRAEWQQAASDYSDDVSSVELYVVVAPLADLQLRLSATDYLDTEGYPDTEISGSVSYSF